MVLGSLFTKQKKQQDLTGEFKKKEFLVEAIFDLIDFVDEHLNFKEALIGQKVRMKYYRSDAIVDLFIEHKGRRLQRK